MRHKILLSARAEKEPGKFKDRNVFAGQTSFVDFSLTRGTLIKAFNFYKGLQSSFSKAAYIMFILTEVHPFLDGNGRIARIFMNKHELFVNIRAIRGCFNSSIPGTPVAPIRLLMNL